MGNGIWFRGKKYGGRLLKLFFAVYCGGSQCGSRTSVFINVFSYMGERDMCVTNLPRYESTERYETWRERERKRKWRGQLPSLLQQ